MADTDKNKPEEEEVVDLEDGDFVFEEEGKTTSDTVKKLRDQVKVLTNEKREYLDGWQRAKADLANYKKQTAQEKAGTVTRANERLIEDLLPVVDSFEMAMGSEAWEGVDKDWRTGVEHIYKELTRVLEAHGVTEIAPAPGDVFDTNIHEPVETLETETDDQDDTVAETLQKGYKLNDRVVRSARVRVYTTGSDDDQLDN